MSYVQSNLNKGCTGMSVSEAAAQREGFPEEPLKAKVWHKSLHRAHPNWKVNPKYTSSMLNSETIPKVK